MGSGSGTRHCAPACDECGGATLFEVIRLLLGVRSHCRLYRWRSAESAGQPALVSTRVGGPTGRPSPAISETWNGSRVVHRRPRRGKPHVRARPTVVDDARVFLRQRPSANQLPPATADRAFERESVTPEAAAAARSRRVRRQSRSDTASPGQEDERAILVR